MKRIAAVLLTMATVAVVGSFTATQAADKMAVAGYDKQHQTSNGPYLSFSNVNQGGYSVIVNGPVAVFDQEIQGVKALDDPARKNQRVWVATCAENSSLFEGATLYALGLGDNWPGEGKSLGKIDLSKALATGNISKCVAELQFSRQKSEAYWQPITWMVKLADGKMAWGGHPGYPNGPYIAHTKNGAPLTAWGVTGNKIIPPTPEVFSFFKTQM